MKKSKAIIAVSIATILCASSIAVFNIFVPAKSYTLTEKKDIREKMKKEFSDEHDNILKGKIPVTEKEINDSAAAGDKLKDKGILIQNLDKEIEAEEGPSIPTKDEILSQINLGIMVKEDGIENFAKNNPNKSISEAVDFRNESKVKQLETLKKLKDDLTNDKISLKEAWEKVLEVRDGKK